MSEMTGLAEVTRNLSRGIRKIDGNVSAGILEAALFVEAEATRNAPIDTGNLRGSAYHRRLEPLTVEVGFGADYAAPVHEIDKDYNQGKWKYLQRAIDENHDRILEIIRKRAQVRE